MTTTTEYPTATAIVTQVKSFIVLNDIIVSDWDDFIYDFISNYDERFRNDPEWFNEEGDDIKDSLRDEVLELLGLN